MNGKFYPKKPAAKDFRSKTYKNNLAEILKVFDEQNPAKLKVISKIALYLSNVVEDGYIERLMKAKFPGSISIGIQLNNIRQTEIMPSLKDMIDHGYKPISIIANLLLQYVKTGRIENQDDIKNEYTDVLYDCIQTGLKIRTISKMNIQMCFMTAYRHLILLWMKGIQKKEYRLQITFWYIAGSS